MFEVLPFKKEHLDQLIGQPINAYLPEWIKQGHASEMEKSHSFTGFLDGSVMVCGGIISLWEGRGYLWAMFSELSKDRFLPVFRGLQKFLDEAPFQRIEMAVPLGLHVAHRRAHLLGFRMECEVARKYLPGGFDCSLYARIK